MPDTVPYYHLYFDLDNTLLKTSELTFLRHLPALAQRCQGTTPVTRARANMGGSNPQTVYLKTADQWYRRGILRDTRLQNLLSKIPYHKFIITNASRSHATLSLKHLGLMSMFSGMIDANHLSHLKPHAEPYQKAQATEARIYGYPGNDKSAIPQPLQRVFFDDLVENLSYPHKNGWTTVLIGHPKEFRHPDVTHSFPDIYSALESFVDSTYHGKKWS